MKVGESDINGFFELFPFFSTEEKRMVVENALFRSYDVGEVIFHEKEMPKGLVCLVHGKAKVYKTGILDKEQILRLVKAWDLLGYRALLANEPYVACAKSLEKSTTCTVSKECVMKLIHTNSAFAAALLQHVSRWLAFADIRVMSLTQKHIRARLADALMLLVDAYGFKDDGQTLAADFTREDLAKLSNMTASNATRTLSIFQEEGLLALNGRRLIRLLNIPAITRISEHG